VAAAVRDDSCVIIDVEKNLDDWFQYERGLYSYADVYVNVGEGVGWSGHGRGHNRTERGFVVTAMRFTEDKRLIKWMRVSKNI